MISVEGMSIFTALEKIRKNAEPYKSSAIAACQRSDLISLKNFRPCGWRLPKHHQSCAAHGYVIPSDGIATGRAPTSSAAADGTRHARRRDPSTSLRMTPLFAFAESDRLNTCLSKDRLND